MRTDPATGKRERILDHRGRPVPHPKWRFRYRDATGRKRKGTGTTSKAETLKLAQRLEAEAYEVRMGYRPPPRPSLRNRSRPMQELVDEYLRWGATQGGRGGRPWSQTHLKNRKQVFRFWQREIAFDYLADLEGCLPQVERALQDLAGRGRSGKTLAAYAEGLRAFCRWCLNREYIDSDPLRHLAPFDKTPKTRRRALTPEEIRQLLEVAPFHRALLYQIALVTGLRRRELLLLERHHVDEKHGGVILDAATTKNRRPGFQPLPNDLLARVVAFANSGEPLRLWEKERGKCRTWNPPEDPLLFVRRHGERALDGDLEKAGIPKHTAEGKIDFHSLRTSYATMLFSEVRADAKTVQDLMRHQDPTLTMNTYARPREDRKAEAVEALAQVLFGEPAAPSERQQKAPA